jgi:serine-type D-Ala-D-Ala carboxypeptidase (penicillin-binding protein 5/6)
VKSIVLLLAATAAFCAAAATAAPPAVQAEAYLVVNGATGEVLAADDARERRPIASITKLMTVLVALERADPDDVVTVSTDAAAIGESTIDLRAGERISVGDLATAALVQSANDAATALAAHVGGGSVERFVGLMNERARALGLQDTHFVNPSGLDAAGHVSSAHDVTRLARIAMRDPFISRTVRRSSAAIAGGRSLFTWNDLLATYPGLLGVKTGHTAGAGWSQVAAARRNGVTVYATILGGPTRAQRNEDLAELLAWGASRYRLVRAVDASRAYATAETGYDRPAATLVAPRHQLRIVRVDRPLREVVVAPAAVSLPIRKGERLGEVRVYAGRKVVARSPLVADEAVSEPGLLSKAGWYAGRTLDELGELVS